MHYGLKQWRMLVNTQIIARLPWVTPSLLLPICNTHLGQDRKSLSFLTPSTLFPSSLLFFFPHLQYQFACQGRWQVKSLPDYWNRKVKSNWIHLPWMAIYSQCWPRHTQMRGRWGRQGRPDGSDKAGVDKEGQGGGFGFFPGGEVPQALVCSQSTDWGSWVMSSEAPRSCWLLSPPFAVLTPEAWVPFICQKPALTPERWAEIIHLSKC